MTISANQLPPKLAVVALSASLTLLAVVAANLVGEATFPLLTGFPAAQVRPAIIVTAVVVALPIVVSLVVVIIRSRERGRHLAAREALLSAAQHYARIGYWEYDLASGHFVLPDVVHQILGDPGKTLVMTVPVLLEMTNPEDRDRLASAFERILQEGTQEQLEYRLRGLDGQEKTFWASGTLLLGRRGQPIKIYGLYQDISERKGTEAALRESEDHYRHAVELNPQVPWTADPQGNILEVSSRWMTLMGLTPEETLGTGWIQALHPDDREATLQVWQASLASGEPFDTEYRFRLVSGDYRWFRARASARRKDKGEIMRWYGTVEDIHDKKVAEIAQQESEAFANSILENTTDGIEVIGLDGRVEYINLPGRRLYEIEEPDYCMERDWTAVWPDDTRAAATRALARARAGGTDGFIGYCATAKGKPKWWDVSVSSIPGPDGRPARLLAVSRDITAHKLAQEELEYLAHHDSLTGLLSRPYFRERLEQQLARTSDESRTALLFLDLDEFKSVNDSLGHPAGDQLLRAAARRLQACLRETDAIARFGGDEFAILQAGVRQPEEAEALARRIIQCLSEPYRLQDQEVVVGTSVGIAVSNDRKVEADSLLRRADIALYRAKSDGRGVYRFFEPGMETDAEERQRLQSELRDALARGEFVLYYQPIVEFATSRVTRFEALLRWQHPRRGLLGPGEFIALAEATGAIHEIGDWVIRQACSTAASWPDDISVSVNLSPRQFRANGLPGAIARALSDSGLPARRLQLEITESVLLQDDDVVRNTLSVVRELGVRLSIDDFGTGYSSLGYLRRFAVDNIKIDLSFVSDLSENPRTVAILWAVMGLGQELGVSITAEGVETVAQMEKLKAMGCHQGQGYLFAHPMPTDEIAAFLEGTRKREWAPTGGDPVWPHRKPNRGRLH